ncbi:MAG: hypothetical protein C0467_28800 [Planctomycetaceae bacterium]|nr:hypothetical protein [Planctomycetaceae bacterium]
MPLCGHGPNGLAGRPLPCLAVLHAREPSMNERNIPAETASAPQKKQPLGLSFNQEALHASTATDTKERANATLYEAGKTYATQLARLQAGRNKKATANDVTATCNTPAKEVNFAIAFADAVDLIAGNCRGNARELLLSDHRRLSAEMVMKISRTHADRQRFALEQARADRDPLRKPEGVDPPFDTQGYAEVNSRMARNAGLIDYIANGLQVTPRIEWPDDEVLERCREELRRIIVACRSVSDLLRKAGGKLKHDSPRRPWRCRKEPCSAHATNIVRDIASVRGIAEKNVRELPRVVRETPPTREEADTVLERTSVLAESAKRCRDIIEARDHDLRTGPSPVFGTYITFFQLPQAVTRVRIGALGTFGFPAGCYAYLGSAFGGGGVWARTNRHLTADTPKKWNIDWLKPRCTPVAVWWTNERRHVEFDWADLLADLPGATFPVRRFGGNDNPSAEAHLVRFDTVPALATFQRRVQHAMPGHALIHEKTVNRRTRHGWPD